MSDFNYFDVVRFGLLKLYQIWVKMTENNSRYSIQGHWRSLISTAVTFEALYFQKGSTFRKSITCSGSAEDSLKC